MALQVEGLSSACGSVKEISLDLRHGEIVGIAGLVGSGKSEVARLIFGLDEVASGSIRHSGGEDIQNPSPRRMLQNGACYFPSDRVGEGLAMDRPIRENATMAALDTAAFNRRGFVRKKREASAASHVADKFSLRPLDVESKVEADLLQLLSGALNVLSTENTVLVGGHTSEGSELALGLTVTGFVDAGTAMRKSGMNTGDILVLTKPLGTGALFAADMRCKAKGRWVCAALCSMTQSNRAAADCLIGYGTTAMTDVSGFGLLGHLVEMTKASGGATTVTLDIVPALDGTLEVRGKGIFSSLHAENVRLRRAISGMEKAARNPSYPLIFDPQTAGGLLASVPADNAESCVNALRELGYESAIAIGEVREADAGQPAIQLLV